MYFRVFRVESYEFYERRVYLREVSRNLISYFKIIIHFIINYYYENVQNE